MDRSAENQKHRHGEATIDPSDRSSARITIAGIICRLEDRSSPSLGGAIDQLQPELSGSAISFADMQIDHRSAAAARKNHDHVPISSACAADASWIIAYRPHNQSSELPHGRTSSAPSTD
jgi:hypothetical protein